MSGLKQVMFRGDSLSALKWFPELAGREAGHQLELVEAVIRKS